MSERTLEELRKAINGKQVVWVWEGCPDVPVDVIFLAPPNGEVVSVKPYGYTPEKVAELLNKHGFATFTVEKVSKPEFCISTHGISKNQTDILDWLADLPDRGTYSFLKATGNSRGNGNVPRCPY